MVKVPVHTRTIISTEPGALEGSSPVGRRDSFAIGSNKLVREFVETVVAPRAAASSGGGLALADVIDWAVVEATVADSGSFEEAIGRAIVIADQMGRGVFKYGSRNLPYSLPDEVEPFFAFTVGDAVPDFGDESRYRSRVARKMGGMLKRKRSLAVSGVDR
jgi:hypothetical protein